VLGGCKSPLREVRDARCDARAASRVSESAIASAVE